MLRTTCPLIMLILVMAITSSYTSRLRRDDSEPLQRALNVLNRKQRSLDAAQQQNYYKLRAKYDENPLDEEEEEEDDTVDFLDSLDNGQLETIGTGYQRLNNKRLEKALINYLQTAPPQRESLFRERERLGGHKRELPQPEIPINDNNENSELAEFVLDVLRSSPVEPNEEMLRDQARTLPMEALQSVARFQLPGAPRKFSSHDEYVPWSDIQTPKRKFYNGDDVDAALERLAVQPSDAEDFINYQLPEAAARSAKERYLMGREYRSLAKRFPVVKRSTKSIAKTTKNMQNTDPKVAEDLQDLFGSQTNSNSSKSISKQTSTSSPVTSNPTISSNGENEVEPTIRSSKSSIDHSIKIRDKKSEMKKSIDWSQYFGIDRRRKKTEFLAKPGSTEQDDEWLLQRYYKTMADNLKSHSALAINGPPANVDKSQAKRDKLDQMDERLKNVKNLIMRDAARYSANEDNGEDAQRVKDIVMSRLTAAYSLEKMRRALNEFRNSITAEKTLAATTDITSQHNHDGNNSMAKEMKHEKKSGIKYEGLPVEGYDEGRIISNTNNCPELEIIERSCKSARGLFVACVKQQVCKICNDEEKCVNEFAIEAMRFCDNLDAIGREHCMQTALLLSQMHIPSLINRIDVCFDGNSCLRRHQTRNRHHFNYNSYVSRNNNEVRDEEDSPMERWL